jgi:tRNA G18 (ribose-2'-O)-methylase SpoU
MADPQRTRVRGYFGMGTYNPKRELNTGTLYRSIFNFGGSYAFTIGSRYKVTRGDTCKHWKHVPSFSYDTFDEFLRSKPKDSILVGCEIDTRAHSLSNFVHPERAVYMLGAEDLGLPYDVRDKCDIIVSIPTKTFESLNVSVAGSIIMYDRLLKRGEL